MGYVGLIHYSIGTLFLYWIYILSSFFSFFPSFLLSQEIADSALPYDQSPHMLGISPNILFLGDLVYHT